MLKRDIYIFKEMIKDWVCFNIKVQKNHSIEVFGGILIFTVLTASVPYNILENKWNIVTYCIV